MSNVQETITEELPSVTEEKLLEAVEAMKNTTQSNNPEDMAAAFFSLSEPRFDSLTNEMTPRELRRVFKKAVLFPFNRKEIKLLSKREEDAYYLLCEIIHHKMIMILHHETLKVEEAEKKLQEAKDNDSLKVETEQKQGETVNEQA
jgi:hypothetical protein